MTTMTEPTTRTLDVPGATLTYDVRKADSACPGAAPDRVADGRRRVRHAGGHFPDRTVVTYDPRGVERSTKADPASPSTPEEHADDLHRIIAELDAGPVDLFASSGGAVNALALVATHPEQVRTLVAHEPPLASILPDREGAMAVTQAIHDTYQRSGFGPGMAQFIVVVSHKGPMTADFAAQPAPDPAMFGLPTEDDGTRTDPLLGQNIVILHALRARLRRAAGGLDPDRAGRRRRVGGRDGAPRRGGRRRAARHRARDLPERPRRLPRRRVRPDRRPGRLRREAARGPRRGLRNGARDRLRGGLSTRPGPT